MKNIYEKYGITEDIIKHAFEGVDFLNINIPKLKTPEVPHIPPNPVIETNKLLNEQNQLLQEQLKELKEQNKELDKQAEDSVKDARKNLIFGWISFGVGTLIGVAGVIVGIIF